jgi:hypothetical protein
LIVTSLLVPKQNQFLGSFGFQQSSTFANAKFVSS